MALIWAVFNQKLPSSWGLRPQISVRDTLELHHRLLDTFPNLNVFENILTFGSISSHSANIWLRTNPGSSFWSSILYLCPVKSPSFRKFLMMSLHVICGLPPIPTKNLANANGSRSVLLKKRELPEMARDIDGHGQFGHKSVNPLKSFFLLTY